MGSPPKNGTPRGVDRRTLVRALARLSEDERHKIVSAAEEEAGAAPSLSWSSLRRARAAVRLGGDAIADCDSLYDG